MYRIYHKYYTFYILYVDGRVGAYFLLYSFAKVGKCKAGNLSLFFSNCLICGLLACCILISEILIILMDDALALCLPAISEYN